MNLQQAIAKLKELRPDLAKRLSGSPTLEEVLALLAEAAAPSKAAANGSTTLTEAQLRELILSTAKEAVGPAVTAALEPLKQVQAGLFERIASALKPQEADATVFDKKVLGKYPYGRMVRALALGTLEGSPANIADPKDCDWLAKKVEERWSVSEAHGIKKWLAHVKTTLTSGVAATAGAMVMPQDDPEWIDLLRAKAVVRGIARTYPMPRGAKSRRKQTGAATAYYEGETGPTTQSNLTVARVPLSYKKLRAQTVESNDLFRFSGGESDRIIQEDLLRVSALREDRAFLVGNPPADQGSPQGIRYQTVAANINASAGTSLANFQSDLTAAVRNVQKNDVDVTPANSYFIMSVSTFWTIYALTTTTGDWVFKAGLDAARPTILGFPVLLSTQLETAKSWIGANSGLIFFVHGDSLEIHDSLQTTIETFRGGAYRDPDGNIQSGISNDETVIVSTAEHDFLQRYDVAAAVITGYAT